MQNDTENGPLGEPDQNTREDSGKSPNAPERIGEVDSSAQGGPMDNTVEFNGDGKAEVLSGDNPSQPAATSDIPTTLGRFKIHGVLGSGGFGTVYLGFDEFLKRNVAIKVPKRVLSGVGLDKFLEEARRLAQLRHPGIVTVFDVSEFDGRCYIVSDYLNGLTLSDWMKSKQYDWREAALITAKLADALGHAHAQGTVHRDIKPSNVMMISDGEPVLIDFGLAVSDAQGDRESPGTVAGTLLYMSPEQARGKAHRIDGRTDIYGLGVMLYRLLCRKPPFNAASKSELARQICDDDPQPIRQVVPEIPLALENICLKAMSKQMRDRFTTAMDLANALRQVVEEYDDERQATRGGEVAPAQAEGSAKTDASFPSSSRMHEAERRQVTTLYLDLDDSNIDVDDLDPEELRSVVQRIQQMTDGVLTQFGGHFARSTSDAIQIYFGYPIAQEDSARQALLAAIEIRSEIDRLQDRLRKSQGMVIDFRIGIHTGIVVTEEVVSEVSSERHSIVGNVPRVSAGLAALAEPGGIAVSGATRQIAGPAFTYEDLGTHSGKAIGRNIEVFQVLDRTATTITDLQDEPGQSAPLVGREHETGLFYDRWKEVRGGSGHVILVCAEAGVGKTRLLAAFREQVGDEAPHTFQARCSSYYKDTALYPISGLLSHLAELGTHDSDEEKLTKLEAMCSRFDLPLDSVIPLIVDLVSIPLGPNYAVFEGSPERRKQKTIEILVELLFAASELHPLMFTIEDLHWVDPTTLDFLAVLIEQIPSSRILLVATHRPEFSAPWQTHAGRTQLMIGNLAPQQTAELIASIAGDRKLPEEVVEHVAEKTGGVPLFAEELTKLILDSDFLEQEDGRYVLARPLESVKIPSTLQDSLMARLDMLGPAKEVAQLAAVIGRDFRYELMREVAPLEEDSLRAELTTLVSAELVQQRGFFPRTRYRFKHALIQDTAYESLLRSTRAQWHGRIAEVIAAKFPKRLETDPALLAHHYTEAGLTLPAIEFWEKAGLQAQERSANSEAINHFRRGLALTETVEDEDQREALEFKFQIPLGVALLTTKGYAAPDVGPVFERAQSLGLSVAGPGEQFFIHWGIWAWRVVREELKLCSVMAEDAEKMVAKLGDRGLQMEALFTSALTSFYLGEFEATRRCCEQGFELYEEESAKQYARHTGQNVGVTMQCYWALALCYLGYQDQAIQRIEQAMELARIVKHPLSLAYALGHSGWLHHSCRMGTECRKSAEATIAVASEEGFPFWLAEGLLHKGFALLLDEQNEDGLKTMQSGLDVFNMTGAKLSLCHFSTVFAEGHLNGGNLRKASHDIDEAVALSALHGNVFYLAEIHRVRGEIMMADGRHDEAQACYEKSLEIARSQNAKLWELRTTLSLCHLWRIMNREEHAKHELASVYDWFQEGFTRPDLVAAKAFLDQ